LAPKFARMPPQVKLILEFIPKIVAVSSNRDPHPA